MHPLARFTVAALIALGAGHAIVAWGDSPPPSPPSTAHKDQYFRAIAIDAYERGHPEEARHYFTLAARHADKPAQLALALMAMGSDGSAPDLASAYAWLDLAAERGYPAFLVERERLWARLDEGQRQRALAIGRDLFAEYGDAVAKQRQWRRVQAHQRGSMASRPSLRGIVEVDQYAGCHLRPRTIGDLNANIGCSTFAGYFDNADWDRDMYWVLQDALWSRVGTVEVGPLQLPADR
jgi:TPR repeat protein